MQRLALLHGEPVAVTSLAGSLMFANPTFAALCDPRTAEELVGISVVEASQGRIAAATLDAALRSDVQQHIHWSDERHESRDFVCTIRCVREDNVPLCLVLALHNADSLAASHRRERDELDSLCEASGLIDAFCWQLRLDEPAARIRWSPHAGVALGLGTAPPPADLPVFLRLISPEDRITVHRAINDAIERSGRYQVAYRLRFPDGSLHSMISMGRVVGAAIGGSRRLIALEIDAARRGIVGDDGVLHERLLAAVLAGTDQPICVLDRQLRYSRFNAAYASLIATTQGVEVACGAPLLESIQDVARRRRIGATLSRALKGERLIETIEFDYPESRTRQWIDFCVSPLLDADGRVEGIIVCGQDVSSARHAEQRRRDFHEELQRRVKVQTDRFDRGNQGLNAILASAIRAFDAPLRRLEIALNVLQRAPDEVALLPAQSALREARCATDEVAALVRELPALPMIATCDLKPEQIDMNRLARDCMQDATAQTAGHHVEFDFATLPPLHTDRALLRLVVRNLLVAAIRLTADRQPATIHLQAIPIGGEVVWTVSNGTDFASAPTHCTKTQLEPAGTDAYAGLAIAIARAATQLLRGRLWAEMAPDRSIAFHFVIAGDKPA